MLNDTTVFFDLETGGLKTNSPIIQIGGLAVHKLHQVEAFNMKIIFDPQYADPKALEINHYDPAVWKEEARAESFVVDKFSKFLSRHQSIKKVSKRGKPYSVARLAGHNIAAFDCRLLRALYERHDKFCPADLFRPLDTIHLAWWKFAEEPPERQPEKFTLGALCAHYKINTGQAHDALADCRAAFEIAKCMLLAPQ